jgi:alanine racemase
MAPAEAVTWAEVDLQALAHNVRELRRVANPQAALMAVVKANGYGHGALEVARVALAQGARYLAVARFDEAFNLRKAGIEAPLLLFGATLPDQVDYLCRHDIRAAVNSLAGARQLSVAAAARNRTLKVHLKIDTGMGRLGLWAEGLAGTPGNDSSEGASMETIGTIAALPGLELEGIFTHFANADSRNTAHTRGQFALFEQLLAQLAAHGIQISLRHAANSAALLAMPETHLNLVRPGIALYGLWPSEKMKRHSIDLRPALTLKSTVIQVKSVDRGFAVSYGSTHVTSRPTRIATIPIGYADGYSRRLSAQGHMLVRGVRAPILGRVCMDLTLIDVGRIPDVLPGDEVVLIGRQGAEEISADEIARRLATINYEVVSALTARVPRVYRN